MARNVVNIEEVSKAFDIKELLIGVSLGVSEGDRIGIVGRNGSGKSTLMKIIAGVETPDSGRVTKSNSARIGLLSQVDSANPESTVGEVVLGDTAKHEWASEPNIREVFTGLFGSFDDHIFDRKFGQLSGGERRRVGLAKLLINELDLILLDEPTNHLDVEGVAWLAQYLKNRKGLAVTVVTHDRWFLDAVTDRTWEVVGGKVEEYDGGYSAFVLAKAERARQTSVMDQRRNMLIKKELAWLRRGAPARTTKPKFRVDAANVLIAGEPEPRDQGALLKFALNRLGKTVYEAHHVQVKLGDNELINDLYWNVGPGDRIGIVGINGAGKTTLMKTLVGEIQPTAGKLVTGITVKAAFLTQHLDELDPTWRVLEAVEKVANRVEIGGGRELSASQLCERLGFDRESQWTPVGDLSGGEKRRLQLTRLLMDSPNVLLLDEPTNDFDIETLTELEDLLDGYGGTLIVISHDRYFLERVCDRFVGLLGDKNVRDLPRGVDEYLELRHEALQPDISAPKEKKTSSAAEERQLKKDKVRLERQMEKADSRIAELEGEQETASFDAERLLEITNELAQLRGEKNRLEEEWLQVTVLLEG
ncbi:Uup ATPase components of ABC transporters with duplicated ATPase domains [Candidatus Planktophila vernalis]|jgi:ATP-binding cassette subfamily F protein uup|uniref:ATP-binding cassette, subfamily F, uup n=1 Tax=Candidatus Planktophila vernalis TaxID=1884907 RepID=A0A249KRG7_9ACTN|nr:ABC-F family ATP-binding cassette domain-containing protein [Candidatus Planktophila vernalis]ASY19347.1 ATP-binding cassette, subfamily F, uup [Candidatus Planktophila vernalis]